MTPRNTESPRDLVESYLDRGLKLCFWPGTGDWKGPRERDWLEKAKAGQYTLADYKEGDRVGILHGVEASPGKFVVDVDIDWGPGVEVAKATIDRAVEYVRKCQNPDGGFRYQLDNGGSAWPRSARCRPLPGWRAMNQP